MTLIDRLSKLDGPDREVDALIVVELEPHIFDAPGFTPIRPIPSFHIDPQGEVIRFDGGGIMCLSYFPRYTASVDAAIALAERVLPGHQTGYLPSFFKDSAYAGIVSEKGKAVDLLKSTIEGGASPAIAHASPSCAQRRPVMIKRSERLSEPAIYKRKGIWMVNYLRERRSVSRGSRNLRAVSMRMKKFFRRKHFEERQASYGE